MRFARRLVGCAGTCLFIGCGGGGDGGGGPVGNDAVLTSITVTPATTTVSVGGRTQINAQPVDQRNQPIAGVNLSYQSSATTVATVDNTGQVTGVAVGQATITVTATQGNVTKTGSSTVTVSTAPPATANVQASATSPPDT